MKLKRTLMGILMITVFAITFVLQSNVSFATIVSGDQVKTFGVVERIDNGNPDDFGYSIGDATENQTDSSSSKIWNIVEYTSDENYTTTNAFCLFAEKGFNNENKRDVYNMYFKLKTLKAELESEFPGGVPTDEAEWPDWYKTINTALLTKINVEGSTNATNGARDGDNSISKYGAILAAVDIFSQGKSEMKKLAVREAGSDYDLGEEYELTDNEITAIEQVVLWYFTNYGQEKYDLTDENIACWLYYTQNGQDYWKLDGYSNRELDKAEMDIGDIRYAQANALYKYLVREVKSKANLYENISTEEPIKVNTEVLAYTESGDNYIIGPINITENDSRVYSLNMTIKNGETEVSNYQLLDENKQEVGSNKTVKDLVGEDFYISIPKSSATNLSVNFNIKYNDIDGVIWTSNNSAVATQPILIPENETKEKNITLTLNPKGFDLALRKYITKVNNLDVINSRVPSIDESSLSNKTTATYKHRKDPVAIVTNDTVTYKLTVYNEGSAVGRAKKIVDQLPTGLEYIEVVSGPYSGSYDNNTNRVTLERNASNTENLDAYTEGNLDSETIEIKCKVNATADTQNSKVLTNVAWISEAYNQETDTTITNQVGSDRDSEPSTTPDVNKDNMSNYTGGNGNKNDLTDSTYYYIGQQDDDDFEKLIMLPESFDLKLIKRITQVNNVNVIERIKQIDVSKLNTLDSNGKLITTADYKLEKNPVPVSTGDIVTYTFRIYNEGMLDGYASEITEDIPEGLEFLWSEKTGTELTADTSYTDAEKEAIEFNQTYLWGDFIFDSNNKITQISTQYLAMDPNDSTRKNLIEAFGRNDGTKTENDLKYKEVSVKLKVVSTDYSGNAIRNEAEISEDTNENGDAIDDRDSNTEEWKKEPSDKYYDDEHKWSIYKEDDEDYDNIVLKVFDLSLRKFIIAVSKDTSIADDEFLKNSDGSYTRAPIVDTSKLNTKDTSGNLITTAIYNHVKTPVEVNKGDYVVYNLRAYNEGSEDGYAAEIKDHLPDNLEFVEGNFNRNYGWSVSDDGKTVTTNYLSDKLLNKVSTDSTDSTGKLVLSYKDVPIMCRVKDTTPTDTKVTNIADITKYIDENNKPAVDRDSQENNVDSNEGNKPEYKDNETGSYIPGQQDDDDFEKVIVPARVDLALTKFITAISNDTNIEDGEYLTKDTTKNNAGSESNPYTRQTEVDTTELRDNAACHDATYKQVKTPLVIGVNSYVLYNIRVYNEGDVDVFAGEVTDYLPENLDFVEGEFNNAYGWTLGEDGRTVKTTYLSHEKSVSNLLKAFDKENDDGKGSGLDYRDLQILCQVNSKTPNGKELINTAEITKYEDKDGGNITNDVDSTPDNVTTKNEKKREEDDDDYEVVLVKRIDLALTKFITAISSDTNIEDGEYLTKDKTGNNAGSESNPYDRQTRVDTTKLRDDVNCHDATYIQVKDPLVVGKNSYVLYNIRVYNEGGVNVYAGEVTDYLPENLDFVEGEFNNSYGWTLGEDGRTVKTTYLSHENGEKNLLKAFDKGNDNGAGSGLDYRDLQILCQVNSKTPTNKELVNSAEITKYQDETGKDVTNDVDSTPDNLENKNEKNREEDDDDYEVVVVKEFDLALRKWVTQAIVIENGKADVTETGHQPYDDPESVVKVELNRKKINSVVVKFRYSIRVINEGDIAGYAKEVTDYIPEGLRFIAEDNTGWTDEGNNVISTRMLENTLLQPGEFADVEVVLTWINNDNNMGVKTNTAEISEDYNEYGIPDRDSIPDNQKPGEDDIDDAPVMLSISTGQVRLYLGLGLIVLVTIAGGIILIKRYVI